MRLDTMYRTLAETVRDSENPHHDTPRIRVHMESGDSYTARVSESYHWSDRPQRSIMLELVFCDGVEVEIEDRAAKTGVEVTVDITAMFGRLFVDFREDGDEDEAEEDVWIELTDLGKYVDDIELGCVVAVERVDNRLRDSITE